ncbi:nickel-dependent lactate racemase [Rubripirellula amarantea]|uniref:Uncharacterized protein n=1 Tax=Rubripirellula amarantea TaxID=2527999 RepID=A0A5C5WE93_9BACT|nr:nickel-dependent lactate racemase [Rubripirellula amarantea]MDA8745148.1 nickel-dependent lactate racemase [Rubripirellula amarantea]TWT49296.1 hypothetical protein Pla22_44900 [Rubripirellula amarantea]
MKIQLAYGRDNLSVDFPDAQISVLEPKHQPGISDERAALFESLDNPIEAMPLKHQIDSGKDITIVHTDITRATPNDRLIPWLLEYLEDAGADRERITLLNGLGTHRPNTTAELEQMLTAEVVAKYRCLNHEPDRDEAHESFGVTRNGTEVLINRHLTSADVRIITGFIEPHFFAGFSGGPKGIMPGVAAMRTVMSNHGAHHIGDARATFGVTEGNPLWEEMRDIALRIGPSFLLNVALNDQREITSYFAGDLVAAHANGIEFVRESAMQAVDEPFDVVVTTNSGYPLDMNLYQAVKGMRAAELIVKEGGTIILAAECVEGVPAGSPHEQLLESVDSPGYLLHKLESTSETLPEQWQGHIQAMVQKKAKVLLYSSLPDQTVKNCLMEPCHSIEMAIANILSELGPSARIGVLPQGPLTIPYLRQAVS